MVLEFVYKYLCPIIIFFTLNVDLELVVLLGKCHHDVTLVHFTKSGQTYDIIFDAVGKTSVSRSKSSLKKKGIFLSTNGSASAKTDDLIFLKERIEAGTITSVIDRRYPLEQIAEAHRYVDKGHKKGNVVITVEHNNN